MSVLVWRCLAILLLLGGAVAVPRPAAALDAEHRALADEAIERGIAYLRQSQNPDGSWTPQTGPAVTGLVISSMLERSDIDANDPTVAKGLRYILDRVQPDGSIRDGENGILANYNTAICLSALSRVKGNPEAAAAIPGAQTFLKGLQWSVGDVTPDGQTITREHPYFGGAGYGRNGRPDMSNTQIMLQGLHDSGLSSEDPAYARALAFIARCQGTPGNDYFPAGTLVEDGGFIYATSINKDHPDIPVSYANPDLVDEARAGRPVSGLRGYGSVTYAGFKSFLYANLDRDDPRVVAALEWIQNNYTLDQNPGMPEAVKNQGLFYYYMTHARALNAWDNTMLTVYGKKSAIIRASPRTPLSDVNEKRDELQHQGFEVSVETKTEPILDDSDTLGFYPPTVYISKELPSREIDWANNLIAKLATLQRPDGSFVNAEPRWMEDDPSLVTAYALIALTEASR